MIIDLKNKIYFTVSVFFESIRDDDETPLWEEKTLLIEAYDADEAEYKAKAFAKSFEVKFETNNKVNIQWKFSKVERTFQVDEVNDNYVEIFSRFLRQSEAKSLLTPFEG